MALLRDWFRKKRIDYFFPLIGPEEKVLEIGSGEGWTREALVENGVNNYTSIDLKPPADIVGDIKEWRSLEISPASYDVIIAFEVVEHVEIMQECYDLLKTGGKLFITTPVPHTDWILKILEGIGLNQKRTSPHSNLFYLKSDKLFQHEKLDVVLGLSQWAVFVKE